jgi:nucleoid DNA-binding protein
MTQDAGISKTEAGAALNSFINNLNTALKKKDGRAMVVLWRVQGFR